MKKGKVFTKSQVALAIMVVALGAAVWLNMRYSGTINEKPSDNPSKYLGEAEYVSSTTDTTAIETAAKPDNTMSENSYFIKMRKDRQTARDEAIGAIEDTLADSKLSSEEKQTAVDKLSELAERTEKEAAIETLLKAKGFSSVLAVIGEEDVNIIVESDGLIPSETLQIQDAASTQTGFSAGQIKIIAMTKEELSKALN
jgi:stage III sporulation protein AH